MGIEPPISAVDPVDREVGFRPAPVQIAPEEILLDAEDVAIWLKVSVDWVWDHAGRRAPFLPAIWLSDGALRFRRSAIAEFIEERERLSTKRRRRR